jgi:hypothetical protein
MLGCDDGTTDGCDVGSVEGCELGIIVGFSVGLFVSPGTVGLELAGDREGREVGREDVGKDVGALMKAGTATTIVAFRMSDSEAVPAPASSCAAPISFAHLTVSLPNFPLVNPFEMSENSLCSEDFCSERAWPSEAATRI